MVIDLEQKFSNLAGHLKRSAIRELLKLTQQPEIISFAGGLPSPESFPIEALKKIASDVLTEEGAAALQYGATEGDFRLRELLLDRYRKFGLEMEMENIVISTASQQALDLLGKIFLNTGDHVICGLPSYLGAISAFGSYGAKLTGIPFDEHGMRSDELRETVKNLKDNEEPIKFIYVVPDFQNPAGITMPHSRRRAILEIAWEYDILIIEDSPYRELRFEGQPQPMFYELDSSGRVITLGTFSKILAPGFRLGWLIAHKDIVNKFVMAKQTADLCSPVLVQKMAARYLESEDFEKNLANTIELYRKKRDIMLESFEKYMPEGVTWTRPEGGLFLFLKLPPDITSESIFEKSIENNVAFVNGAVFHCSDCGHNTMRINFSYPEEDLIREGVKRLAKVISESLSGNN